VMKGESHLRQTLENNGQFAAVARTSVDGQGVSLQHAVGKREDK